MSRERALAFGLFSVGFTAIIGQILLMRELVATLYGNELLFGLILTAWLAWGAVGAALAGRRPSSAASAISMSVGLAAAALLLPAQLALVRGLRTLLGVTPGSMLDLGPLVVAVALVLAPICLCLGALFSIGARLAVEATRTPGWAYVWDSIGAVAGGFLFSFLFLHWLNPFQTALLVSGTDLAVALLLWPAPFSGQRSARLLGVTGSTSVPSVPQRSQDSEGSPLIRQRDPSPEVHRLGGWLAKRLRVTSFGEETLGTRMTCAAIWSGVFLISLAVLAFPLGRALQAATLRWQWADLAFAGDSPYGRLTVQARGQQRIFYTDGALTFETQSTFPEEVAHLALLAHPAPRDVLLIGGGIAGDLREVLEHPVGSVTYVELDPLLIQAARDHLPTADAVFLDDPRVRLVLTDGRAFITKSGARYDAIILDLPEPTTGALNRFYTVEFFAQAKELLRPGGILSFGLPSAENYWNPELAQRNASIVRTLGSVFPSVTVLPGEHDFFLAGNGPLEITASRMSERLAQRGIHTRWVTPAYLQDLLTGDRFAAAQASVKGKTGVRVNRDLSPLSYYYSLAHWLARFDPGLREAFESAGLIKLWWLALPMLLCVLLARWRRGWAVWLMVAGVGLALMLVELVLLFAFQALHGSLYGQVSLIVTAFMGGLALGGAAGNRVAATEDCGIRASRVRRIANLKNSPPVPLPSPDKGQLDRGLRFDSQRFLRRVLVAVLAGIALYGVLLPLLFSLSPPAGGIPQLAFTALAVVGGVLGGMVFPLASRLAVAGSAPSRKQPSVIRHAPYAIGGRLYAADLAGGCVGALLGAALFIPTLGIPQTCAAIALLALAGLLVML